MSLSQLVGVLICVAGISVGQVLFKLGANDLKHQAIWKILLNPYIITAVFVYGLATVLWVYELKYVSLAKAYPLFALAFLVVPLLGWLILGERPTLVYVIGVVIIILGIVLATRSI